MGWKASFILVNERGPGYLGTRPPHEPDRARTLIADLGLGRCQSLGMTTFEVGIYPQRLDVGAYDGAAIIGHPDIANSCLHSGADPLTARVLTAFPQAAVLRVGLHSIVNLWGYAYFEGGRLVRAYGGTTVEGVVVDEGDQLPGSGPTSSGRWSGMVGVSSAPRSEGRWRSSMPRLMGSRWPSR